MERVDGAIASATGLRNRQAIAARETRVPAWLRAVELSYRTVIESDETLTPEPAVARRLRGRLIGRSSRGRVPPLTSQRPAVVSIVLVDGVGGACCLRLIPVLTITAVSFQIKRVTRDMYSSWRRMSRLGREFELLVKSLEGLFADSSVKVTSPDKIIGKVSGTEREVDVTLRSTVGSVPVLIAIECRDRNGKGGLEWMEQLRAKRDDIGAHKIIAVSRSGFSKNVRSVAQQWGIEARTLKELTPAETFDWLEYRELTPFFVSCRLAGISIEVDSAPPGGLRVDFPDRKFSTDSKIFFRRLDGTSASVNDLLDYHWITRMSFGMPLDEPRTFTALLHMLNPEDETCLRCVGGSVSIRRIELTIEVVRTRGTSITGSLYEYSSEDAGVIAQGFDVRIPDGEGSTKLAFHRSGDGQRMSIHVRRDNVSRLTRHRSPLYWYGVTDGGTLA